jgi:hypothetical protein
MKRVSTSYNFEIFSELTMSLAITYDKSVRRPSSLSRWPTNYTDMQVELFWNQKWTLSRILYFLVSRILVY